MKFCHDGLKVWYGTDDAPAPEQVVTSLHNISITVGVYPLNPNNKVMVHYRLTKGGLVHRISGVLQSCNYSTSTQYFLVRFPSLPSSKKIEYSVQLSCVGRQVPSVIHAQKFPNSFVIDESFSTSSEQPKMSDFAALNTNKKLNLSRFPLDLDYLATVKAQLKPAFEMIGATPEGIKVNWFIDNGQVKGPKLNAVFCSQGGDWMTIRPDGIGILGAHATLQTVEGALIQTMYSGVFDLGEKGYQNFLDQKWPPAPLLKVTPRFLTEDSQYQWLNRLQCIGIGEVKMSELVLIYDLYAL